LQARASGFYGLRFALVDFLLARPTNSIVYGDGCVGLSGRVEGEFMRALILASIVSLSLAGASVAHAQSPTPTKKPLFGAAKSTTAPAKKPLFGAKPTPTPTVSQVKKPLFGRPMTAPVAAKPAPAPMAMQSGGTHKGGGVPVADRSAISISCSKQADAKGLHGKDREKFRRSCMK
jgi:hypothetical protein